MEISRQDLIEAVEEANVTPTISEAEEDALLAWAETAESFTYACWSNCPLTQVYGTDRRYGQRHWASRFDRALADIIQRSPISETVKVVD